MARCPFTSCIAFGNGRLVLRADVRLLRANSCDHGPLDEPRIRKAVMAGVAVADVQLHPAEIVYCEGDSPRYELYEHCSCMLAQRVASSAEFIESYRATRTAAPLLRSARCGSSRWLRALHRPSRRQSFTSDVRPHHAHEIHAPFLVDSLGTCASRFHVGTEFFQVL
jgi:hypothetical protein